MNFFVHRGRNGQSTGYVVESKRMTLALARARWPRPAACSSEPPVSCVQLADIWNPRSLSVNIPLISLMCGGTAIVTMVGEKQRGYVALE